MRGLHHRFMQIWIMKCQYYVEFNNLSQWNDSSFLSGMWWLLNNFILLTVIYLSTHPYNTNSWKPWFTCNHATFVAYHPSLDCQTENWECFCRRNISHLSLSFLLPFCNCLSPSESFASVKLTWAVLQRYQLLGGEDSTALTFFLPFLMRREMRANIPTRNTATEETRHSKL